MNWHKRLNMGYHWKNNIIYIALFFTLALASCRSTKNIPVKQRELENISEARLFKNIADNELVYNTIYSKKMEISLKSGKDSKTFKATMQVQRDSFIWVSMSGPMGIGEGRLLLTGDSIKFYNSYDKVYFTAGYDYLVDKYDINLSFDCLQKMISNHFFSFESCTMSEVRNKKYKRDVDEGNYLLYTLEEKAIGRKLKRLDKKKRKNKEFSLILQKFHIDPDYFRPVSISMEDLDEQMGIRVNYKKLAVFDERVYPGEIVFNVFTETDQIKLTLSFSRLEFDVPVKPSFKIPAKYKRME